MSKDNETSAASSTQPIIGVKLALALLAVQQEIGDVERSSENPYFESKYAKIEAVIDTIKPVLNKHGIAFFQFPSTPKFEGNIALTTILLHAASGESYSETAEVPLGKSDPQGYGSAITYTRRYSLVSIMGLKTVDDDGNASSGHSPTVKRPTAAVAKPAAFSLKKATPPVGVQKNNAKPKTGLFPKVATQPQEEATDEA